MVIVCHVPRMVLTVVLQARWRPVCSCGAPKRACCCKHELCRRQLQVGLSRFRCGRRLAIRRCGAESCLRVVFPDLQQRMDSHTAGGGRRGGGAGASSAAAGGLGSLNPATDPPAGTGPDSPGSPAYVSAASDSQDGASQDARAREVEVECWRAEEEELKEGQRQQQQGDQRKELTAAAATTAAAAPPPRQPPPCCGTATCRQALWREAAVGVSERVDDAQRSGVVGGGASAGAAAGGGSDAAALLDRASGFKRRRLMLLAGRLSADEAPAAAEGQAHDTGAGGLRSGGDGSAGGTGDGGGDWGGKPEASSVAVVVPRAQAAAVAAQALAPATPAAAAHAVGLKQEVGGEEDEGEAGVEAIVISEDEDEDVDGCGAGAVYSSRQAAGQRDVTTGVTGATTPAGPTYALA